jgi:hypothetical protein
VYVSSNKSLSQLGLVPPRDPSKNDLAFVQGNAAQGARTRAGAGSAPAAPPEGGGEGGGGGGLTVQGLPIMKPPYGMLAAIDLNKGQMIWQIAHGETPANITNHPLLKGLTIREPAAPARSASWSPKRCSWSARPASARRRATSVAPCCARMTRRAARKWGRSTSPLRRVVHQ